MTFKIWGTEDLTRTSGKSVYLPAITALANGGYVALWLEDSKFLYHVYDGNGVKTTAQPLQLEAGSTGTPEFAQVTAVGTDGNFAVTWSEVDGSNGKTLYSRVYDADGKSVTSINRFTDTTGKSGAQIVSNDAGGWGTAYVENGNVKFTEFDNANNPVNTINKVFDAASLSNLDVAWLGGHKYLVAYHSDHGKIASIVDAEAGTAGTEFNLDAVVAFDVIGLKDSTTGKPSGEFVVIEDLGANAIIAQRYNATGQKIGNAVPIGGAKPNSDFDNVTAVALKTGGYALAYIQADAAAGDLGDVYIKVVDAAGNAGPEMKVNARANLDSFGSQRNPAITEMADGRLSITWQDPTGSAGNGSNISSTIVDARAAKIDVTGTSHNDVYAPSEFTGDVLDGGLGFDTLTFKGSTAGVAVDLVHGIGSAGDANGDTYTNFEKVIGTNFNDTLTGGTGHVLVGGAGNDIYYVSASDTQIDESGGGYDQVYSSVSYSLSAGIENLFATGANAIDLYGNGSNNVIAGNEAANRLTGNGGDDTLYGYGGNDALDGGDGNDVLLGGAGDDTLQGGDGNDALYGSDGNDALDGGTGNDVLYGGAGADNLKGGLGDDVIDGQGGADTMDGGAGNDTYYIDDVNDLVQDSGAGDVDTVVVSVNYDLNRLVGVENITGVGSAAITLTGNGLNNVFGGNDGANILYGGAGNDQLNGMGGNDRIHGGLGADMLTGGTGRDIFVFDTNPKVKRNADKITDYNVKDDSIYLENKYFKALGKKGTLKKPAKMASKVFYSGTKAHDKDDHVIYDKKKGVLYYDDDGIGSHKAIVIATLKKGLKMTYHDFFVI